jgi:hypothetical protein
MEPETKAKIFNTTILRGSKKEGMLDDNNSNLVKKIVSAPQYEITVNFGKQRYTKIHHPRPDPVKTPDCGLCSNMQILIKYTAGINFSLPPPSSHSPLSVYAW